MTHRLPTATALALVFFVPAPASRADDKPAGTDAVAHPVVHVVVFYLKADSPPDTADRIVADCHDMLAKIPTVRILKAGRPTDGAPPPAKKNFSVGLVILFDDLQGLKAYINHPLHKQFVAKHLAQFDTSKLAGYDFTDAKK